MKYGCVVTKDLCPVSWCPASWCPGNSLINFLLTIFMKCDCVVTKAGALEIA